MERDPLLVEREKSHGSFDDNALIWHRFSKVHNFDHMNVQQQLVMNMIFLKLSRAIQQPHVKDHWDDIAGYAKLASEACEEGVRLK